jgi:transketolase
MNMREEFVAAAVAALETDPRVVVVLADISSDAFLAARRRFPERVINVGIREQLMVSVAGGLALAGMRPIIHTYAPFAVSRAFEQLKLDLTHQDVDAVVVTIGASYDVPTAGTTHFAPEDIALIDTLPGWHAHVPAYDDEVEPLLARALKGGRHYIRLTEQSVRRRRLVPPTTTDVIVIAVGPTIAAVEEATAGSGATVLPMTTVRPFDADAVRRAVPAGREVVEVVLVEPYLVGTSAHDVAEALKDVPHRLLTIGVQRHDLRHYGTVAEHDTAHGLDSQGIRRAIGAFQRIAAGAYVAASG